MQTDVNLSELLAELKTLRSKVEGLEAKLATYEGSKQDGSQPTTSEVAPKQDKTEKTDDSKDAVTPRIPSITDIVPTIPMSSTRVVMHQLVPPGEVDILGICFGGQVLSWIDVCAGLAAKTLARGPCVTASVDAVHFLRPVRVGMVVIIAAMVNRTFSSSMEVGVRVEAEDMRTGLRYHCCSAYLTFVAVGDKKAIGTDQEKAKQLPRVNPDSATKQRIYGEAEERRQARLQQRQRMKACPDLAAAKEKCRLQPITRRQGGGPTLAPAITVSPEYNWLHPKAIGPDLTSAYMTQSIMPHHANTLGITFGGQVMRWMEQCAVISSSRLRAAHTLIAAMDSLTFNAPTKVGHIMYISSQVTAIFGSSLEVMVSVHAEDPLAGGRIFHCNDAFITMVAVDEAGAPVKLPFSLQPSSPEEKMRYEDARERRRERLLMRQALRKHEALRSSLDGKRHREHAGMGGGASQAASIPIKVPAMPTMRVSGTAMAGNDMVTVPDLLTIMDRDRTPSMANLLLHDPDHHDHHHPSSGPLSTVDERPSSGLAGSYTNSSSNLGPSHPHPHHPAAPGRDGPAGAPVPIPGREGIGHGHGHITAGCSNLGPGPAGTGVGMPIPGRGGLGHGHMTGSSSIHIPGREGREGNGYGTAGSSAVGSREQSVEVPGLLSASAGTWGAPRTVAAMPGGLAGWVARQEMERKRASGAGSGSDRES